VVLFISFTGYPFKTEQKVYNHKTVTPVLVGMISHSASGKCRSVTNSRDRLMRLWLIMPTKRFRLKREAALQHTALKKKTKI